MLLDERVPEAVPLDRELARRYFLSRGPATVQDFAHWSGLTVAVAGTGLEAVKSQFEQIRLDGRVYWVSSSGSSIGRDSPQAY